MSRHLDVIELVDYAIGAVPAERTALVREHCAECEECGDRLAAVLLLRQTVPAQVPARPRVPHVLALAAGIAAVAIGMRLAGVAWLPPTASAVSSAPTAVIDVMEPALASLLWTADLYVGAAAVGLADTGTAPLVEMIRGLREGDAERAIAASAGAGDSGPARLLTGVAQLQAGNVEEALTCLQDALQRVDADAQATPFVHAARLYLAEALLQAGRTHAARVHLDELVASTADRDTYQEAAAARLTALDSPASR